MKTLPGHVLELRRNPGERRAFAGSYQRVDDLLPPTIQNMSNLRRASSEASLVVTTADGAELLTVMLNNLMPSTAGIIWSPRPRGAIRPIVRWPLVTSISPAPSAYRVLTTSYWPSGKAERLGMYWDLPLASSIMLVCWNGDPALMLSPSSHKVLRPAKRPRQCPGPRLIT